MKDLISKFYLCPFQYLDLLEESFDRVLIFNWKNLHSVLNGMNLRRSMVLKYLNLMKHSKYLKIERRCLTSFFKIIVQEIFKLMCSYILMKK